MNLSQVVFFELTAALIPVIVRLNAVPPTIEWTCAEGTPGLTIGSDRCTDRTPQFTVQTSDAWAAWMLLSSKRARAEIIFVFVRLCSYSLIQYVRVRTVKVPSV